MTTANDTPQPGATLPADTADVLANGTYKAYFDAASAALAEYVTALTEHRGVEATRDKWQAKGLALANLVVNFLEPDLLAKLLAAEHAAANPPGYATLQEAIDASNREYIAEQAAKGYDAELVSGTVLSGTLRQDTPGSMWRYDELEPQPATTLWSSQVFWLRYIAGLESEGTPLFDTEINRDDTARTNELITMGLVEAVEEPTLCDGCDPEYSYIVTPAGLATLADERAAAPNGDDAK